MAKQFKIGDKVFAKVRGYPPWPAQIQQIDNQFSKCKYHVIFYGTFETSVCKIEDLFVYDEFKDKFGISTKRLSFMEALAQIENEDCIPRSFRKAMDFKCAPQRSELDAQCHAAGKTVSNNRKRKISCDSLQQESPAKQDKLNLHPLKKVKKSDLDSVSNISPPVVTRCGRVVKPKKSLDDTLDTSLHRSVNEDVTLKSNSTSKRRQVSNPILNKRFVLLDGHIIVENGKTWTINSVRNSNLSVTPMECGESKIIKEEVMEEVCEKNRMIWFLIEACLLELELKIRSNMSLSGADIEATLEAFHLLFALNVQPLMLKKHPHVVRTLLKMRRYVGNVKEWDCAEGQRRDFLEKAKRIRRAAETLLHKFTHILTVSDDDLVVSFKEILSEFETKVKDLSHSQRCALIHDPTVEVPIFFPGEVFSEATLHSTAIWEAGERGTVKTAKGIGESKRKNDPNFVNEA